MSTLQFRSRGRWPISRRRCARWTGQLKIRVRSLENEQALSRLQLSTDVGNKLLVASLLLNLALGRVGAVPSALWFAGAGFFGLQAGTTSLQIKAFDKKKAKYETKDFGQ